MKINKTIALLLALVTVFTLAACNRKGQMYSEKNAYVSVYVYGENGKGMYSADDVRVAPLDEEKLEDETMESGLLTEESARNRYRTFPTPMYALETCIANKEKSDSAKNAAYPVLTVSQLNDGTIKYNIDSIKGNASGKVTGTNDIFEWKCEVYDYANKTTETVDPFTYKLNTYDKVTFTLSEVTYRTFTVAFEISKDEETLIPETEFNVEGEKSELNISKYLSSDYIDDKTGDPVQAVSKALGITLSEDGKRVVKIGDYENDDGHRWICYIGDEEDGTVSDLTNAMISERLTIYFEYVEIASEETDTGEVSEEIDEIDETDE